MKFSEVIRNVQKISNLRRNALAYVHDSRRVKDKDELINLLEKTSKQYFDEQNIIKTLDDLKIHNDRNVRTLYSLFLKTILLEKLGFQEESRKVNDEIRIIEQEIVNIANKPEAFSINIKNPRFYQLDLFKFILKKAWEHNEGISVDEKNLILSIQEKLGISDKEYMIIEAQLNHFPKEKKELHTSVEFDKVRRELLTRGLLFEIRDNDGSDVDIIPEEIAFTLRKIWNIELRRENYYELLKNKYIKNKSYLSGIIERSEIVYDVSRSTLNQINEVVINNITPSNVIGGFSPRDGLNSRDLISWLKDIGLSLSGSKSDKISKIVEYYDNISLSNQETEDERSIWFEYYEALASRNIELLRKDGIVNKDNEIEKLFEKATYYAFETMLKHVPQKVAGTERPDGILSFKESIIMWDNKSKERDVNLNDHIKQFERYISTSQKEVIAFIVIGPSFTNNSVDIAERFSLMNDTFITLITAKQFKELCVRWSNNDQKDPLPLNYFRKSGLFNPRIIKY